MDQLDQPKNIEKMAALGRLTRGLVHDFNNSLGSILGYAEFLTTDLPPNSEQHLFATNIKTAAYQMQELLDQIRALAQEQEPALRLSFLSYRFKKNQTHPRQLSHQNIFY